MLKALAFRQFSQLLFRYLSHSRLPHLVRGLIAQVSVYGPFYKVNERCQRHRHHEFVRVVYQANRHHALVAPALAYLEGNEKYYEAVHQLRYYS